MPGALQLIKALSEPVRIRLYLLLKQSSLTVSELSEILYVSQSNTSHHLKALRELGLLSAEKTGQHTYYALDRKTTTTSRIASVLRALEEAATEIAETASDNARLRKVLAARNDNAFARWRREQPDLPYTDVFAHLACGRRGAVLDLGCGEGDFFDALTLSFEQVFAVDIDLAHVQHAKNRSRSRTLLCCADAQQLPFGPHAFDAVVLRMALSQIAEPERALGEAVRVLKIGGFISIIDADADSNRTLRNAVTLFISKIPEVQLDTEHILPGLFMLRVQKLR